MPLHTVVEAMLTQLRQLGRPPISAGTADEGRALMAAARAAYGAGPEIGRVQQLCIPTRAGSLPVRLLQPTSPPIGLVVYLHGGGWALGALDDFDHVARALVARSGCAVLMPDYRLAPEHPFPAGLEDAEDATRWAATATAELGSASLPLVLAGDSAGANLAAVTARTLRGEVRPVLQALIYPVADCDFGSASYAAYGEGLILLKRDMQWFFDLYAPAALHADPRISPLRAADLSGLPPAHVVTAEYDVLRDEGEAYAQRLREAGVPTELRRIAGLPHGFARMINLVDTADAALTEVADAIAAACRSAAAQRMSNPE
ncbi:MAG: alpha/beta hydrolase [Acetobacteraceae bacterium]|nr:alpha/beta hydrolase [Acetobacteraceae bacterium]